MKCLCHNIYKNSSRINLTYERDKTKFLHAYIKENIKSFRTNCRLNDIWTDGHILLKEKIRTYIERIEHQQFMDNFPYYHFRNIEINLK